MSALVKQDNVKTLATPATLLQVAVEQNADLDKLERLMDLQERYDAKQAESAFNKALADFQSELGPIIKKRKAHNSTYADLDDIAQAIRPILEKHGLSYQFKQDQGQAGITVTCIVRHTEGHEESNSLTAPNDTSGGKNAIQSIASTVTYLRRYTLTGGLGITTGNEDNDGGKPAIGVEELLAYINLINEEFPSIATIKESLATGEYSEAKEAWQELGEDLQKALWRAPSKGGIFTTIERQQMRSDEWRNS